MSIVSPYTDISQQERACVCGYSFFTRGSRQRMDEYQIYEHIRACSQHMASKAPPERGDRALELIRAKARKKAQKRKAVELESDAGLEVSLFDWCQVSAK